MPATTPTNAKTPTNTKKTTRSNSATGLTLADIEQLITKSKEELMNQLRSEMKKINGSIKSLTDKIGKIEENISELKIKNDEHDKSISDIKTAMRGLKANLVADIT